MEDQEFNDVPYVFDAVHYAKQYWHSAEIAAVYFAAGSPLTDIAPLIKEIDAYIAEGAEGFTGYTPSEGLQNLMDAVAALPEPTVDETPV